MQLNLININRMLIIGLSTGLIAAAALGALAQEQPGPFKKEPAGVAKPVAPLKNNESLLVTVDLRMIELPRAAADEIFKEQGGIAKIYAINEKTLGAINALVANNKAKVAGQAQLKTKSGSNAELKSVQEIKYVTSYKCAPDVQAQSPETNGSITNRPAIPANCLIPDNLEIRDVGMILNVTPVIMPDGKTIDVTILPQRVRLSAQSFKSAVSCAAGKTEVEQPKFISEAMATSIQAANNTTVLMGVSGAIEDQETTGKTGDNIILWLLTVATVAVI